MIITNERLQDILKELDASELTEKGSFGIFKDKEEADEIYIVSNKEGLLFFVTELIQKSIEYDEAVKNGEEIHFYLEHNCYNEESDIFIDYIKPITKTEFPKQTEKISFAEKLIPYGCFILFLIIMILILIGIVTVQEWFFHK